MEFAKADPASVMLDGQELSARQRFALLIVLSTEPASQMPLACVPMVGKAMIALRRSAPAARMEFARMEFASALMATEEPHA